MNAMTLARKTIRLLSACEKASTLHKGRQSTLRLQNMNASSSYLVWVVRFEESEIPHEGSEMLLWPASECGLSITGYMLSKELNQQSKKNTKIEVFTHSQNTCRHARRFDQEGSFGHKCWLCEPEASLVALEFPSVSIPALEAVRQSTRC